MTKPISLKHLSRSEWNDAILKFQDLNYCQCGAYAEAAARQVGASAEFMACFRGNEIIGLAAVRIKTVPLLPIGIAYLHYGPLTISNGKFSAERFGLCIEALKQEYVKKRQLVLRVVPPVSGGQWVVEQGACLELQEFRRSGRFKSKETFILDLVGPLAEIRKNIDVKWRSDLVKAEKSNIQITRSDTVSDIDYFEPMFSELLQQKNFSVPHDVAFFRRVQECAQGTERLITHLAWHEGELLAGHIGTFVGEQAIYLLGASTAKGRHLRASYLLQWAAIEYAKLIGNRYYDLGGIDEHNNPDVYRFKKRLNGRRVLEIGVYEFSSNLIAGYTLQFLESVYNFFWLPARNRINRFRTTFLNLNSDKNVDKS